MTQLKNHLVTIAGLVVMAASAFWGTRPSDSAVPNDANIGAGVLFMFGIVIVIVGLAMAWTRRSSAVPPPPTG